MDPVAPPSPGSGAHVRGWLEAAICDASAALPPTPPHSTKTDSARLDAVTETLGRLDLSNGHDTYKRKLATVRRIGAVTPVNKSHSAATIDGWKVITKKANKFSQGDLVLFLEVDAFLPSGTEYENLFTEVGPLVTFDDEEGYRVGTSVWTDWDKNKVISQGHIFHLSNFPHIDKKVSDLHFERIELGPDDFVEFIRNVDFSGDLGITKWQSSFEPTEDVNGIPIANPKVPPFILKTDMDRVQNCPNLFTKDKYRSFIFQESIKLDGASMTVYFVTPDSPLYRTLPPLPDITASNFNSMLPYAVHPTGRLGVCTRNQDLLPHLLRSKSKATPPTHILYWTAALAAKLHILLPTLAQNIAIQAELIGANIQGNPYGYAAGEPHQMLVFSVLDLDNGTRWHPRRVHAFAAQHGLKHVPVLGYHKLWDVARKHQDLVDRAELKRGEGLVYKNCEDGRWFKVLSTRWILEKGDEAKARAGEDGRKRGGKAVGMVKREGNGVVQGEMVVGVEGEKAEKTGKAMVEEKTVIGAKKTGIEMEGTLEDGPAVEEKAAVATKKSLTEKRAARKKKVEEWTATNGGQEVKQGALAKADTLIKETTLVKEIGAEVHHGQRNVAGMGVKTVERAVMAENGEKEKVQSNMGWEMDGEDARKIQNIFADLDEWVRRDDGLQKWMDEWKQGLHGGPEVVKPGNTNAGKTASNGVITTTKGVHKAKLNGNSAHKTKEFGVSTQERKDLADWLGIDESA